MLILPCTKGKGKGGKPSSYHRFDMKNTARTHAQNGTKRPPGWGALSLQTRFPQPPTQLIAAMRNMLSFAVRQELHSQVACCGKLAWTILEYTFPAQYSVGQRAW